MFNKYKKILLKTIIIIFLILFFNNYSFAIEWTTAIWVRWWFNSKLKDLWKITFNDWTINLERIYANKEWIRKLLQAWKFYWWDSYYNND